MKTCTIPNISCPACRSALVCRAEYEGVLEQTILRVLDICPFWCQACGMRFYMFLASSPLPQSEQLQTWLDAERCRVTLSSN
jgi:hypothetical protein